MKKQKRTKAKAKKANKIVNVKENPDGSMRLEFDLEKLTEARNRKLNHKMTNNTPLDKPSDFMIR